MDTETVEVPEKPKPKRHARANRRPVPTHKADPYEGITPSDCPSACRPDRCCITQSVFCAHPHKGGLQARLQTPENLRRYNEAKRTLGKQKLRIGDA